MALPACSRRTLLAAFAGAGVPALLGARVGASPGSHDVLAALTRAARPLRTTEPDGDASDLRALGVAIGATPVLGFGEVVHGAHELSTLKHRVFRHLVRHQGFTAFALETSWPPGCGSTTTSGTAPVIRARS